MCRLDIQLFLRFFLIEYWCKPFLYQRNANFRGFTDVVYSITQVVQEIERFPVWVVYYPTTHFPLLLKNKL